MHEMRAVRGCNNNRIDSVVARARTEQQQGRVRLKAVRIGIKQSARRTSSFSYKKLNIRSVLTRDKSVGYCELIFN